MAATAPQVHFCRRLQSPIPKPPASWFHERPTRHQQTTSRRNKARIGYTTHLLNSVSWMPCWRETRQTHSVDPSFYHDNVAPGDSTFHDAHFRSDQPDTSIPLAKRFGPF